MMEHVERSSDKVWVAKSRFVVDMWIGFITTALGIRVGTNGEAFLSKTGGRLLLTGKGCPRKNPYKDFPVDYENPANDDPPGYFVMVVEMIKFRSGSVTTRIILYGGQQRNLYV